MRITNCSASSESNEAHSCEKAFDGNENSHWRTKRNEIIGAWIKINLDGVYSLTKMMLMLMGAKYHAKDVSLAFSNGEQLDFTLHDTN